MNGRGRLALLVALVVAGTCAAPARAQGHAFTPAETRAILELGPWPPPTRIDPSNRVGDKPEAIALGRRLFFDAGLSASGRVSCSSCHRPERAWSDGRARAIVVVRGQRNTPSLYNVGQWRWLGWSGAGDSLWAQSIRPLLDRREMGASAAHVSTHLSSHADLAAGYAATFGRRVGDVDAQSVLVDAAKALAAYQATIVSPRTTFDRLRDSLESGDGKGVVAYPLAAARGLALFVGRGRCAVCHGGRTFGGEGFAEIDPGARGTARRIDGIRQVLASQYNLHGGYSDDPARAAHWRVAHVREEARQLAGGGAYTRRVPSLRHVAHTAPYLHDGSSSSLAAAIRAHRRARSLSPGEISDLVRFLETLSDSLP